MRKRIVITGSSGLVGSRVIELLRDVFEFIPLSQQYTNITNRGDVRAFLHSYEYDALLHLAAYTNVDGAEQEKENAFAINVEGTKNLLEENEKKPMIYISTGFVFSGNSPPYDEFSKPHPISVYGKSKYEGEKIVSHNGMIVRIEYPYRTPWEGKMDFVARIHELLASGKKIQGITDSTFTPTLIDDIAYCLQYLLLNHSPTTYHIVGNGSLSPYDAALMIAKTYNLSTENIEQTTYEKYFSGRAHRPRYASITSVRNNFHTMKSFSEGLRTLQLNHK